MHLLDNLRLDERNRKHVQVSGDSVEFVLVSARCSTKTILSQIISLLLCGLTVTVIMALPSNMQSLQNQNAKMTHELQSDDDIVIEKGIELKGELEFDDLEDIIEEILEQHGLLDRNVEEIRGKNIEKKETPKQRIQMSDDVERVDDSSVEF